MTEYQEENHPNCRRSGGLPVRDAAGSSWEYLREERWEKPRASVWKRVLIGLAVGGAVCLAFFAPIVWALFQPAVPGPVASGSPPPGSDPPPPDNGINMTYTNQTSTLRVEALSTRRSQREELPPGSEALTVELCLTNLSGAILPFDGGAFELCVTGGRLIPAQENPVGTQETPALGRGRLLPGGKAAGCVEFHIPQGETVTLLFLEDSSSGQRIFFPLL